MVNLIKKSLLSSLLLTTFLSFNSYAETKKIGIFPFEVTSIKSEFKDLGVNSSFNIIDSINSTRQFEFSNFDEITKIIKVLEIKPSNISDYSNIIKASKYLNLDIAVSGILEPKADNFVLEYKIIDVKNNKILKSIKTQSKNLFELHSKVALELVTINNKNISTAIKNNLAKKSSDYKNIDVLNNLVKSYNSLKKYSYEGYDASKIYAKKVLSSNKDLELAKILSIKSNIFTFLQKKLDNLDFDISKENIDLLLNELNSIKSDSYEIKKLRAYLLYLKKDNSFNQELKNIPDMYLKDPEIIFLKLLIKDVSPDNTYFKNLIEDNFIPAIIKSTYFLKSKGKYDDAEELYKESLKLDQKNSSLNYGLGLIYFKTARLEEAILKFNETVKIYPKFVDAYIYLGNSYKYSENYSKAIESYKKAIYHNKDKKEAYFELAKLYTEQGELNKAEENYKEVVRIAPNDYQAHYHLATCYKLQDKLDEAISSYNGAIKLKPDFVDAYYNLGIAYKYIGELEKAENSYKSAIKLKSDFAEARLNLGVVYFEQDKINESISEYQNAIKIKPDYPRAYNNMGSSYEKLNKYTEALNSYKKAIELNPDYASAYYNLALLYKNKKMNKEAMENYKKACSLGYHPACGIKN
jgi:tetratricopeptide (TPR) repeat protein